MRALLLTALLFLSACASQGLPTSEKLEAIRQQKQDRLATDMDAQGLELGQPAFIRVFKYENTLEAWLQNPKTKRFELYKTYPICNYSGTLGPKRREGDRQAPEGFYEIGAGQMNPWSQYHLSFNLGYPNEYDRAQGHTGSNLMIHGNCKSDGCFAITDNGIEDVYLIVEASIRAGHDVPVHIFPFRMTNYNMTMHYGDKWLPFWQNLKQGYDAFESTRIPPEIALAGHRYHVAPSKQPELF